MPGLTVCYSPDASPVAAALTETAAAQGRSCESLRDAAPAVWNVSHATYPVHTATHGPFWFALEGVVYDAPGGPDAALQAVADRLASPRDADVQTWVERTDGVFVLLAVHQPTQQWTLLTDAVGTLPLYLSQAHGCITRTFALFHHLDASPPFDRIGAAQQLHLESPLGPRTLLEGVKRLPPATCLRGHGTVLAERTTFDSPIVVPRPVSGSLSGEPPSVETLTETFVAAVDRRATWRAHPALALSGGLDSRAVACACAASSHDVHPMTLARADGNNRGDVDGAKAICAMLDLPGEIVRPGPPSGDDLQTHVLEKGGMNALDVSFMIPFTRHVAARTASLLTGEGGLLLRDVRPWTSLASLDDVIQHLGTTAHLSLENAARCVGLPPETLRRSIRDHFASGAGSPDDAYARFRLERVYTFTCEGEDRNRSAVWSTSPFLSVPFVQRALRYPMHEKRRLRLYRRFLETLHAPILQIGYPDLMGLRLDSPWLGVYRALRSGIRSMPGVRQWANRLRGKQRPASTQSARLRCLRDHLNDNPTLLDATTVRALVEAPEPPDAHGMSALLTLAAVDRLRAGAPSLLTAYAVLP